jgi:hypothetical protein
MPRSNAKEVTDRIAGPVATSRRPRAEHTKRNLASELAPRRIRDIAPGRTFIHESCHGGKKVTIAKVEVDRFSITCSQTVRIRYGRAQVGCRAT